MTQVSEKCNNMSQIQLRRLHKKLKPDLVSKILKITVQKYARFFPINVCDFFVCPFSLLKEKVMYRTV